MKSEEKLLKEMGISSWTLKKNFSFDGKQITKKDIKNISTADLKFLKSLSISLRQEFSDNYPEQIFDYLSANKVEIDNLDVLKTMSAKEKKELLINIEKN
tara:strand:+ start:111 stop:410 length:300 start_codon:yes stop_codon:yes gene_type:complete